MRPAPPLMALCCALALLASACVLQETTPEPLPPPPAPSSQGHVDDPPRPYYVGEADLPLYAEPSFTSEVKARLALNENLLRHKVLQGFAYVEVMQNGLKGWVDNAALAWRKQPPPSLPPGEDIPPDQPGHGISGGPISETF